MRDLEGLGVAYYIQWFQWVLWDQCDVGSKGRYNPHPISSSFPHKLLSPTLGLLVHPISPLLRPRIQIWWPLGTSRAGYLWLPALAIFMYNSTHDPMTLIMIPVANSDSAESVWFWPMVLDMIAQISASKLGEREGLELRELKNSSSPCRRELRWHDDHRHQQYQGKKFHCSEHIWWAQSSPPQALELHRMNSFPCIPNPELRLPILHHPQASSLGQSEADDDAHHETS